jgi:hypothetical protein
METRGWAEPQRHQSDHAPWIGLATPPARPHVCGCAIYGQRPFGGGRHGSHRSLRRYDVRLTP